MFCSAVSQITVLAFKNKVKVIVHTFFSLSFCLCRCLHQFAVRNVPQEVERFSRKESLSAAMTV